MKKIIVVLFSLLLAFSAIFLAVYPMLKKPAAKPALKSFEECAAAGFPIMESYPRQCRDGAGILHSEVIKQKFQ